MHQMKIAMSIDFDASRCGGKNGRAQIYQQIHQHFVVFPMNSDQAQNPV
jgi:hypothetical protein